MDGEDTRNFLTAMSNCNLEPLFLFCCCKDCKGKLLPHYVDMQVKIGGRGVRSLWKVLCRDSRNVVKWKYSRREVSIQGSGFQLAEMKTSVGNMQGWLKACSSSSMVGRCIEFSTICGLNRKKIRTPPFWADHGTLYDAARRILHFRTSSCMGDAPAPQLRDQTSWQTWVTWGMLAISYNSN